jgi:DNA-binding transcriptional ArsR family regulator
MHICLCVSVVAVGHEEYESASELFRVLSAPLRLAIIDHLTAGPAAVHALVAASGESQPLISQHLRVLRAAKLIRVQTNGRERVYSLTDEHVAHIVTDAIRHTSEPSTAQEETIP